MSPQLIGSLWAVIAALCWAGALMIVRVSGAPASVMPFIVASGSITACLPTLWFVAPEELRWRAILIAFIGALLNGAGMVVGWNKLVGGASAGQWQLTTVMPIAYSLIPMFVALASVVLLGERLSTNKSIGIVLAIAGIYFLNRK
jgi:drug/metabolite transporter (DMT)-like permease